MDFSLLLPIYILVALGYLAVRFGYVPMRTVSEVNLFVVKMIVPVVIFLTVYNNTGQGQMSLGYLFAYGIGSLIVYFFVFYVLQHRFEMSGSQSALLAMGAAGSNSIMLGLPIVVSLYPKVGENALAMCIIIESIFIIPISLALSDQLKSGRVHLLRFMAITLKNPIVIAIILGLTLPILTSKIWAPLDLALITIRNAMAGMSLLIIGALLAKAKFHGAQPTVVFVSIGKLVLMPAAIFLLFKVIGVEGELLLAGMTIAALSVFGIYANFCETAGEGEFGASVFFVTTLLVPISLWIWSVVAHGFN